MSNKIRVGRTEILGPAFVGKDEIEAAREGSRSDRTAMARRLSSSDGWGWNPFKAIKAVATAPLKAVKYSFTVPYRATKSYITHKQLNRLSDLTRFSGDEDARYPQMLAAAKKAGQITEPQLEVITQELFKSVGAAPNSPHRDTLRTILRENLARSGVKIVRA